MCKHMGARLAVGPRSRWETAISRSVVGKNRLEGGEWKSRLGQDTAPGGDCPATTMKL